MNDGLICKVSLHTPGRVKFDVTIGVCHFQILCDFVDYPTVKRRLFAQFEEEFDIAREW